MEAKKRGLDVIAITDHNAVENSYYVAELGDQEGLKVIYGMEAQSVEEVHLLCYFQERTESEGFFSEIYPRLPDLKNNADYFGDQVVVDLGDEIIRFEEKLLLNSLTLSIGEVVETVSRFNGKVVPAHVDSEKFGLLFNMGFVPEELRGAVLEVSYNLDLQFVLERFPELSAFPIITNSDAHYLQDIGRAYTVTDVPDGPALLDSIFARFQARRFSIVRATGEQ